MDVASKMPLIISLLLPSKAENNRKNARTSQKSPDKIMQCFKSSRVYGTFFYKYQQGNPLKLSSYRLVERPVAQALCLDGGKEARTIRAETEPPETLMRQNMAIWLQDGLPRNLRFPILKV
jgi:hypothetical protein